MIQSVASQVQILITTIPTVGTGRLRQSMVVTIHIIHDAFRKSGGVWVFFVMRVPFPKIGILVVASMMLKITNQTKLTHIIVLTTNEHCP